MSDPSAIRRAIAALRAGRTVRIEAPQPLTVVAVETATGELLDLVDPNRRGRLLISGERAAALSLTNERDAADPHAPVLVERAPWLDAAAALAVADPGRDLERGPLGPLHPLPVDCAEAARAALGLARSAGLLPALWIVDDQPSAASVAADDIDRRRQAAAVALVARARLP
ncbi:MAG: GTP cyclohydrolase II, partial [Sphingomicrobium sp.]